MTCPFLFTTQLAQHKYIKNNAYARSMCKKSIWTSSKCGNTKTPWKHERTNGVHLNMKMWSPLQSKLLKEKLVNVFDAIGREFGKNTWGRISKTSSCVQANHHKEQVFIMFVATRIKEFTTLIPKMSQIALWLHTKYWKEKYHQNDWCNTQSI